MKLPLQAVRDLDHRITALLTFTIRNDSKWFDRRIVDGKDFDPLLGDVYSTCLEGSSIMARALLEVLGLSSNRDKNGYLDLKASRKKLGDLRLDHEQLQGISAVDIASLKQQDPSIWMFLARIHDETSKRTAHRNSGIVTGMAPKELRQATKWIIHEFWKRCFNPDPITIHPHLFIQLNASQWEGIPFQPAQ